jgi:hypothetical protein
MSRIFASVSSSCEHASRTRAVMRFASESWAGSGDRFEGSKGGSGSFEEECATPGNRGRMPGTLLWSALGEPLSTEVASAHRTSRPNITLGSLGTRSGATPRWRGWAGRGVVEPTQAGLQTRPPPRADSIDRFIAQCAQTGTSVDQRLSLRPRRRPRRALGDEFRLLHQFGDPTSRSGRSP